MIIEDGWRNIHEITVRCTVGRRIFSVVVAHIPEILVHQIARVQTVVDQTLDVSERNHQTNWKDSKGHKETLIPPQRQKVLF